ncbi:hypothetical protein RD110_16405 [Rhodoferax koreense]|uniref:Nucleotidyltransferase n=1 Tax=Rhodoferax koreensis TaxID=1842727 RepID=A0A1P8JXV3_9BURK|nr:nucleotidyltransferase family protein [Rhodoferax koreense]APW38582.1 hypothetical protein RD110_16405 [Rhodoferax koreense]
MSQPRRPIQRDLILRALLAPASVTGLSPLEWDLLIRQGRRANLLARLAYRLGDAGLIDAVPPRPRLHLLADKLLSDRQIVSVQWEVECLRRELADAKVRTVLLKGAAYVMAGLPAAAGRTFSDIDIIVPKTKLADVESWLMAHGWQSAKQDEYDQRYYRQWMHEIPPLTHIRRGTSLDVHHAILPETARIQVNTPALFEGIVPLPGAAHVDVLQPWDMLLHSATHLFHEGELDNGLRDLFDLDSLLRHFGATPGFWEGLVPRALHLGLQRPLYYALRYTTLLLETPVPEAVLQAATVGRPAFGVAALMDACYTRALRPAHASTSSLGTWPARFALYVRSHWIRMPFGLLALHLGRKAFVRPKRPEPEKVVDPHDDTPAPTTAGKPADTAAAG